MFIKKLKDRISKKLAKIKEKTLWNGVIRSVYIGYLKFLITIGTQFIIWLNGSLP
jgi:hypothetical protein